MFSGFLGLGQSVFELPAGTDKEKISFENLFNLMIVSVEVNGTPMKFILDTGVENTILFSVVGVDSVIVNQADKLEIRGLGSEESVIAYRSLGNHLAMGDLRSTNAEIFVVLDANRSFLPRLGTNINGIIGTDFFRKLAVEIDYERDRLTVYPSNNVDRRWRRYDKLPLKIYKGRPYIKLKIPMRSDSITAVIDTGNSDALWIYPKRDADTLLFDRHFKDYLGWGLNGSIYGRRGKLDFVNLNRHNFQAVTAALPDSTSVSINAKSLSADGNVGAELLRRFDVVINYEKKLLLLKPNRDYSDGFYYNMSGLTLTYGPPNIMSFYVDDDSDATDGYGNKLNNSAIGRSLNKKKIYKIVDNVMVDYVRPGSPASKAGISVGDEILKFNGRGAYSRTLSELMQTFYTEPGKRIRLKVKRADSTFRTSFRLAPVLPDSG